MSCHDDSPPPRIIDLKLDDPIPSYELHCTLAAPGRLLTHAMILGPIINLLNSHESMTTFCTISANGVRFAPSNFRATRDVEFFKTYCNNFEMLNTGTPFNELLEKYAESMDEPTSYIDGWGKRVTKAAPSPPVICLCPSYGVRVVEFADTVQAFIDAGWFLALVHNIPTRMQDRLNVHHYRRTFIRVPDIQKQAKSIKKYSK